MAVVVEGEVEVEAEVERESGRSEDSAGTRR